LSRDDFTFDKMRNVYICPQGKLLHTTGYVHDGTTLLYRARVSDCGPCPLKPRCCPKAPERKIPRSIHEDARDVARALVGTPAFEQSRRNRKRVEMLFAHLKRILRLGRLRLRGPRGAQDEFTLGAIAPEPPPPRVQGLYFRRLPIQDLGFTRLVLGTMELRRGLSNEQVHVLQAKDVPNGRPKVSGTSRHSS
jgi:hypothetical protein